MQGKRGPKGDGGEKVRSGPQWIKLIQTLYGVNTMQNKCERAKKLDI